MLYAIEILRQKWRLLCVIVLLLLINIFTAVSLSYYQLPALGDLHNKWRDLRSQAARVGQSDAAALHRQGSLDLEKLQTRIPEKRQFARVLSDLFESASSSAVVLGPISYQPIQIKEEGLLAYKLTLSAVGRYAEIKSFLSDLQSNSELLVVDTVAFSNSDPFVENVTMSLQLTVYLRGGA